MKALVLDDDPAVCRAHCRVLESEGFEVTGVHSAGVALGLLADGVNVDVVLTDVRLPGMDGITFLRAVRRAEPDLPVIVVTGQPDVSSAAASVEYGAYRYLIKPVEKSLLVSVALTAVRVHKLATLKRQAAEFFDSEPKIMLDRTTLDERFTSALEKLWLAYQPIVNTLTQSVYGYEALVRSREPTLPHPGALFDAAERLGRLQELGRQIRDMAALKVAATTPGAAFFVNLHAADLNDAALYSKESALSKVATRVILEITERRSLEQVTDVQDRMKCLRKLGFRIAIDDLGAGYAGLSSFGQLEPEVVKIDMSLVRDIDAHDGRQRIVRSMVAICRGNLGIEVICEGVETPAERDTLTAAGCQLLQGYLFGRPESELALPKDGSFGPTKNTELEAGVTSRKMREAP